MSTGAQLRDQGHADVLAADVAIHRDFAALISEAVDMFAKVGKDFDAEAVRRYVTGVYPDARPHSPNVYGATLGGLAAAGRIEAVGYRSSTRPSSRARVLRVWRAVKAPRATSPAARVEEAGRSGGLAPLTPAPPAGP